MHACDARASLLVLILPPLLVTTSSNIVLVLLVVVNEDRSFEAGLLGSTQQIFGALLFLGDNLHLDSDHVR